MSDNITDHMLLVACAHIGGFGTDELILSSKGGWVTVERGSRVIKFKFPNKFRRWSLGDIAERVLRPAMESLRTTREADMIIQKARAAMEAAANVD